MYDRRLAQESHLYSLNISLVCLLIRNLINWYIVIETHADAVDIFNTQKLNEWLLLQAEVTDYSSSL